MADRAILGADTLYARGKDNLFIAKYGATRLVVGALGCSPLLGDRGIELSQSVPPQGDHRVPRVGAGTRPADGVYDVLGRELAVLVDERQSAGSHSAKLDASSWPSGVYLYRLEAGNQVATGRLVRHK